jgi:hypothetical protein
MKKGYSHVRAQKRWVVPLVELKIERLFPLLSPGKEGHPFGHVQGRWDVLLADPKGE